MKKAILFFVFSFVLGAFAANAQSCHGSASTGATKACCADKVAKAAAADPSIEKRTSQDGTVAYVRKEADAQGNVQFVSVQYDEAANKFVNVAPKMTVTDKSTMTKKTACCSSANGSSAKACAGAGASTGTKACCANKSAGACSDKKAEQ